MQGNQVIGFMGRPVLDCYSHPQCVVGGVGRERPSRSLDKPPFLGGAVA